MLRRATSPSSKLADRFLPGSLAGTKPAAAIGPVLLRTNTIMLCRCVREAWDTSHLLIDAFTGQCDFSYISCAFCKAVCIRHKFSEHHNVCPEVMMVCPQGGRHCGAMLNGGMRKRREMQAHLDSECGNWKCVLPPRRFHLMIADAKTNPSSYRCRAVETCETRTKRANLPQHEAVCDAAAKLVIRLEKRLVEQQAEISALKSVLAQHQAKVGAFEPTQPASAASTKKEEFLCRSFSAAFEESLAKIKAASTRSKDLNKRKASSSGESSSNSASSSGGSTSASSSRSNNSSSATPDAKRLRRSNSG